MKIKWFGHSAFLITSDKGIKIITDPYTQNAFGLEYKPLVEPADIVTVSHDHADHNNAKKIPINPQILKGAGNHFAKGLDFHGVATCHDDCGGKERGDNTAFVFTIDKITICHLGDLGHILTDEQVKKIGPVDVLMIPVGGNYTIDFKAADKVIEQLKPRIVMPMHYQTEKSQKFQVMSAGPFLEGKKNIKWITNSKIELKAEELPRETQIWVLRHEM